MASNNPTKTRGRGRPFAKGNSYGKGRPAGSRNKATLALQSLLEGEGEALARKAIELALEGDTTALRLCLERLIPPAKDKPLSLKLPNAVTVSEIAGAVAEVLKAVAAGEITPSEGQAVAALLDQHRKALETAELERRIEALERAT